MGQMVMIWPKICEGGTLLQTKVDDENGDVDICDFDDNEDHGDDDEVAIDGDDELDDDEDGDDEDYHEVEDNDEDEDENTRDEHVNGDGQ